jgi:parallel beta-helix repeat protein
MSASILLSGVSLSIMLLAAPAWVYADSEDAGACGAPSNDPCVVSVDSPAGTYDDVQDAVDEADDGATITVMGTCRGSLRISRRENLTIQGVPPASGCPFTGPEPGDLASTLKNGRSEGIKIRKSKNIEVRYLNIVGSDSEGVELEDSKRGALVCNCIADHEGEGVELDEGAEHTVSQNLITGNEDDGIQLKESEHNTITANNIHNNGDDGVAVEYESERNTIGGNWIRENDEDGIDLDDSDKNTIVANEVFGNGRSGKSDNGIELRDADRNVVDGNEISDNADGLVDQARCQSGAGKNTGSNVPEKCGETTDAPMTFVFPLSARAHERHRLVYRHAQRRADGARRDLRARRGGRHRRPHPQGRPRRARRHRVPVRQRREPDPGDGAV